MKIQKTKLHIYFDTPKSAGYLPHSVAEAIVVSDFFTRCSIEALCASLELPASAFLRVQFVSVKSGSIGVALSVIYDVKKQTMAVRDLIREVNNEVGNSFVKKFETTISLALVLMIHAGAHVYVGQQISEKSGWAKNLLKSENEKSINKKEIEFLNQIQKTNRDEMHKKIQSVFGNSADVNDRFVKTFIEFSENRRADISGYYKRFVTLCYNEEPSVGRLYTFKVNGMPVSAAKYYIEDHKLRELFVPVKIPIMHQMYLPPPQIISSPSMPVLAPPMQVGSGSTGDAAGARLLPEDSPKRKSAQAKKS